MNINDEWLERLGVYFVYHRLHERYGITFEQFVKRSMQGDFNGARVICGQTCFEA